MRAWKIVKRAGQGVLQDLWHKLLTTESNTIAKLTIRIDNDGL